MDHHVDRDPAPLRIGTDGASIPNPGPCGWAWVDEHGRYRAGSAPRGTNNLAELTAILYAVADHPEEPLRIETDSQYAIDCVTRWGPSWIRRGITGKANQDIVVRIIGLLRSRPASAPVELVWVRGHCRDNRHPLNTVADRLASTAAATRSRSDRRGITDIDWAPRGGGKRATDPAPRVLSARRTGVCPSCRARFPRGARIAALAGGWGHEACLPLRHRGSGAAAAG